ncbi:MAG TPA: response regulator transcription factor [Chloroflexota bacterium]
MDRIKILLVDDHPMVRDGLAANIETQPDMEVVGQAGDGQEGLRLAKLLKPDVVLMDLQMPKMGGLEAIQKLRQESERPEVIILTAFDTDEHIFSGLEAGARGYLLKGASRDELLKAIRAASRGESLLEPAVASKLVERFAQISRKGPADDTLSDREVEVLRLMAKGLRNKEIARDLVITEKTAKAHVSNILAKLGAADRTEAVTMALKRRIIKLDD